MATTVDRLLAILQLIYACATVSSFLIPKDEVIIDHHHPSYRSSDIYFSPARDERATWSIYSKRLRGENPGNSYKPKYNLQRNYNELQARWLPLERSARDIDSYNLRRKTGLNTRGSYATKLLQDMNTGIRFNKRDVGAEPTKLHLQHTEGGQEKQCTCQTKGNPIKINQRASWLNTKRGDQNSKEIAFDNVQNIADLTDLNKLPNINARASWMSVKKSTGDGTNQITNGIENRASWLQVKKSKGDNEKTGNLHLIQNRANWLPIKKNENSLIPDVQQRASWLPVKKANPGQKPDSSFDQNVAEIEALAKKHQIQNRASWMNIKKRVNSQPSSDELHTIRKRATWIPTRDLSHNTEYTKPTHTLSKTQHFINGRDIYRNDMVGSIPEDELFMLYGPQESGEYKSTYRKRLASTKKQNDEYGNPYDPGYIWNNKRAMWLPTRDLSKSNRLQYGNDLDGDSGMETGLERYQRMLAERELERANGYR